MALEKDECPRCAEEIWTETVKVKDASGKEEKLYLQLQAEEVEIYSPMLGYVRGHERHWKYCPVRVPPETTSASDATATE